MNDLLLPARLQAALGDAYVLERELGGGGMISMSEPPHCTLSHAPSASRMAAIRACFPAMVLCMVG